MWNANVKILLVVLILAAGILAGSSASGEPISYTLNAPFPGGGENQTVKTIQEYAELLFPFILSVTAGLAFVAFIYGGIQYLSAAGNPSQIGEAKSRMWNALLGLLLAALSILILRTINPELINLNLNIPPI